MVAVGQWREGNGGSSLGNALSDVGTFFKEQVGQRLVNGVTGDGFNTNSQVIAREILKLPEDKQYAATLMAVNSGHLHMADMPFRIAPVAAAVEYADNLKSPGFSFGKNGANANKIIRALAATYQTTDEAEVRDNLLKANGVTSIEALQAKIAKGEEIKFAKGQEWVSGVTQKAYSALGSRGAATIAAPAGMSRINGETPTLDPTILAYRMLRDWIKGSNPVSGARLTTGEVILSELPSAAESPPIIWRKNGVETGRAVDHTGSVAIYKNSTAPQPDFWDQFSSLGGNHSRDVLQEDGTYERVNEQHRADIPGARAWAGPNSEFQVLNIETQRGRGGTVTFKVGENVLTYVHLDAISDDVYKARVNGGTGEMLKPGTMIGYTKRLRGLIWPDNERGLHLHLESRNTSQNRDEILRIMQGR